MLSNVEDKPEDLEYDFVEKLGQGNFGTCYMAVEKNSGKYHACKVFKNNKESKAELAVHSKLSHPHIVEFFRAFRCKNTNYMLIELCENDTLALLLKCRKTLTNPEVRYFTRQIVHGLQYLHDHLVIHRDLKLTNVMLTSSMIVKIGDFGLSKKLEDSTEKRVTICGTHNYIAPEVLSNEGHGFEVDIWALGCIIYTLLDGNEPFAGKCQQDTLENIRRLSCASSKRISQVAWRFLKTIFIECPKNRPTAHTTLDHIYFCTGFTPDKLDYTAFYQKPTFKAANLVKNLPLRDRTNKMGIQTTTGLRNIGVGKENIPGKEDKPEFTMALRPRKGIEKTIFKKFAQLPPFLEAVADKGAKIATILLSDLKTLLQESEVSNWSLKLNNSSFLCVTRWVSGLSAFGYHLSDGSLSAHFMNEAIFHRNSEGLPFLYQFEDFRQLSELSGDMDRSIRYIDQCLKLLDETGPKIKSSTPSLVVAKKFYPFAEKSTSLSEPKAAFLLSNGACQMNFTDHEKLLVNRYEDLVACWTLEECRQCSLRELSNGGIPPSLRPKLQLMCLFLSLKEINC